MSGSRLPWLLLVCYLPAAAWGWDSLVVPGPQKFPLEPFAAGCLVAWMVGSLAIVSFDPVAPALNVVGVPTVGIFLAGGLEACGVPSLHAVAGVVFLLQVLLALWFCPACFSPLFMVGLAATAAGLALLGLPGPELTRLGSAACTGSLACMLGLTMTGLRRSCFRKTARRGL